MHVLARQRFALIWIVVSFALLTGTASAQCGASLAGKTIFLVRHAEKAADDPRDPTLSPAGQARAGVLLHVLGSADITALYATEFKRTQQTLAPLAAKFHLETAVVPARDMTGLVQRLRETHGGAIVVAGHSNTINKIIEALGAGKMADIDDAVYDNLFVVIISPNGDARLLKLKYGFATPAAGKSMAMPAKP